MGIGALIQFNDSKVLGIIIDMCEHKPGRIWYRVYHFSSSKTYEWYRGDGGFTLKSLATNY